MSDFRSTAATNFLLAFLGLATGTLSARLLGPNGRGDLAIIQLWPTVLATIAMLGLPEALVFFGARERHDLGSYLGGALAIAVVSSVVFGTVGWILLPFILTNHPADLAVAAQHYLLIIPVFAFTLLPTHPLRGLREFGWWNLLRIGPSFTWLIILLVALTVHLRKPAVLANLSLAGLLVVGALAVGVVLSKVPGPYRPRTDVVRALLLFGLPAFGATLPQLLNLRLDQLVMTAVVPARDLGFYVVAVAWSTASMPILIALGQVVFPRLASEGDVEAQRAAFASASRSAIGLATVSVAVVGLGTPVLMPLLLSARFKPAVPPAMILIGAGGVYGYSYVLAEGIRGLGRPMVTLCAEMGGLVATGLSLALLLAPLGIMGAALSSLCGYSTVMLWYCIFLRRHGWIARWSEWLVPRRTEFSVYAKHFARIRG